MDLLQYGFFQHALLGSLLTAIACGIVGTYIVSRRLVFISGGITHASFRWIGVGVLSRDESDLDGNVVFRALRIRGGVGEQDTECA